MVLLHLNAGGIGEWIPSLPCRINYLVMYINIVAIVNMLLLMSVLDGPVSKKVKGTAEIDEGKLLANVRAHARSHTHTHTHTMISTQMESGAALIFWGRVSSDHVRYMIIVYLRSNSHQITDCMALLS